ncbi:MULTISPECIES: hypothetical protein [Pseudomonas]|uniref:Secreted protein n=3 Tax=Pseudomonas chlororaphis TaxID=587753 RepID=A0AAP9VSG9_9PSED|nr:MULTISPECIES: hypothetical protein [Pseudomonas]AIC22173.1 hypothetical protein EY04_25610 [Pseudomonas chlororaphis]AUG42972.1 hypothetical protein CXP47_24820 [Pseudomonas chlororaphis]AZD88308.1 hypothetical protein C4K14_5508 [Pseudomonas chlororaphis subsp. aureofaciens]AZD94721.1 hypothetical protein C4K13_5328 [Pseudomonas chlororaphis subsp. aureofaciens]AZE01048.1 hypothetical protein C4K12_5205 [Pseudomonas chlororaphis subsp. aureofaciens]
MSNSMGIASAFVLSSLFLAPMAMAEESQTFAAHNAARAAAFQEAQEVLAAKQQNSEQPQNITAEQRQPEVQKDS